MTQQKAKEKPFFVYLPTNAPHMPLWPDEKYADMYRVRSMRNAAAFFAMIANLDDNIGRLDEWLKKSGLYEDTIVVFLPTMAAPRAGKFIMPACVILRDRNYEGGHRAACFIRWPKGGFTAGLDVAAPTQVQDLLPTLLELCNVSHGSAAFDGVSLLPLMSKNRSKTACLSCNMANASAR